MECFLLEATIRTSSGMWLEICMPLCDNDKTYAEQKARNYIKKLESKLGIDLVDFNLKYLNKELGEFK